MTNIIRRASKKGGKQEGRALRVQFGHKGIALACFTAVAEYRVKGVFCWEVDGSRFARNGGLTELVHGNPMGGIHIGSAYIRGVEKRRAILGEFQHKRITLALKGFL